jgi:hypothetical protein
MRSIFIDESKSKGFLLCAVEVDSNEVPELRRAISSLRLKGQSDIHFVSESPRRKREILSRISGFGLRVLFIRGYGAKETVLRRASLEKFVSQLLPRTNYQVWLDLDESHLAMDKKTISLALASNGLSGFVTFTHSKTRQQPLLLLPDALAWARTRGGEWNHRIESLGELRSSSL